jgi:hypothetical protein
MSAGTITALVIAAVFVGLLLYTAHALIAVRAELDRTTDELIAERKRRWSTEDQARNLIDKVTPLIAQTDWMTGRWKGQFETLQRMEKRRNEQVVAARRALWTIPLMVEYIRDNTLATTIEVEDQTK